MSSISARENDVQAQLAAAVRRYVAELDSGLDLEPFPPGEPPPSATEVVIAVSRMLEAVDVEVFELGLWNAWGTPEGSQT